MIPSNELLLFAGAALLMVLTPGPNMIYLISRSICQGRRAGVISLFGVIAGFLVHMLAAAVGLSAVFLAIPLAYALLKWVGAAYLLYVGVSMLRARRQDAPLLIAVNDHSALGYGQKSLKSVFVQGFGTNALNPKVALFFLAFLPLFIAPQAQGKTLAFLLLGLIFNFNGLWVNLGWARAAVWARQRLGAVQARLNTATRWMDRVAGVMFVGFGLKLAFSESPQP